MAAVPQLISPSPNVRARQLRTSMYAEALNAIGEGVITFPARRRRLV